MAHTIILCFVFAHSISNSFIERPTFTVNKRVRICAVVAILYFLLRRGRGCGTL
jgi:hypothetical protein